ncbi:hypothetical protein SCHPADRAFT_160816 [Schizopora paradoxa]|uniref:Uncharacterized protein n=1 Tax=Schizopora paradoxa TaxID=27342 RepID=A0A0H2S0P7_9AGAM|nr:hypothetical protein SCHPADRAFT_160816 [Schizopora paradoxa]
MGYRIPRDFSRSVISVPALTSGKKEVRISDMNLRLCKTGESRFRIFSGQLWDRRRVCCVHVYEAYLSIDCRHSGSLSSSLWAERFAQSMLGWVMCLRRRRELLKHGCDDKHCIMPNEFAAAQSESSVQGVLNLGIAGLGSATVLSVTYSFIHDVTMLATPGTLANSVDSCTGMQRTVEIIASNSGPFFSIFGPADSEVLVGEIFPLIKFCGEELLSQSPSARVRLRSESAPHKRVDPVTASCPVPAPTSVEPIVFKGMSD